MVKLRKDTGHKDARRMRKEEVTYEKGCGELLVSIADYMQYGIKLPYKAS